MKLQEYIKEYGVKGIAEKTGNNPLYIRQIGWGKARPSLPLAKKIVRATNGLVTFEDLTADL